MKNTKSIKNLKILLTDVDCVLTDGGMYYTSDGDIMKKFHTRDGMGVNLLKRNGIPTIIVTKEKTPIVKKWAEKMNIEHVYDNVQKKEDILKIITKKYGVDNNHIDFVFHGGSGSTLEEIREGLKEIVLSNSESVNPTFIAPNSGSHTFKLTVSDSDGRNSSDEVVVTVEANSDPVADAGDDQIWPPPIHDGVVGVTAPIPLKLCEV